MNKYLRSIFDFFKSKPQVNKRNYDAGKMDRLSNNWFGANATPEHTDARFRPILMARCRDLERNSDIVEAILSAFTRNSIGPGLKVQARVNKPDGTDNIELNNKIEKLWNHWSSARNCDLQGQLSLADIQKLIICRRKVDGGIFIVKNYDKTARIPLKLQVLEYDNLDNSMVFPKNEQGITCINGIELDVNLKPVAYWFKQELYDALTTNSIRVEADKVIHLYKKSRPGQILGVTEFAGVMRRIKDISDYVEAEIVAQRLAACFSLFIHKEDPTGALAKLNLDDDGRRVDSIEPGMIEYLKPGEKITVAEPGRNSQTAKDFIEMELRLIAAGMGLSYEAVARNMKGVNFSSSRTSTLEDRRTYQQEQQFMSEYFLRDVYTEFVISAVLAGELNIPDFWKNKYTYMEHEWMCPGWTWVDPKKDAEAAVLELSAGITTLAEVLAGKGKDWQEVIRQRAREQAYAQELGLALTVDNIDLKYVAGSDIPEDDVEDDNAIE